MAYSPTNGPVSTARNALISAEHFIRRRRAAAAARAQSQALHLKVGVAFSCAVLAGFATAAYHATVAARAHFPSTQAAGPPSRAKDAHVGSVQIPRGGQMCQFQFDNRTGTIVADATSSCGGDPVPVTGATRNEAVRNVFSYSR
jgi:hypothetical protein